MNPEAPSSVTGKVPSTTPLLLANSATRRVGTQRKKKILGNGEQVPSNESSVVVPQDTVNTTDSSTLSPGAVPVQGIAPTTPVLFAKSATRRVGARKKKILGNKEQVPSNESSVVVPQDNVNTTDFSSLSPGAVPVQGIAPSLENSLHAQQRLRVSNSSTGSQNDSSIQEVDHGTDNDNDQAPPSMILTARVVDDDGLVEEDVEKRIQEGVESRLRTGTVLAEELVSEMPNQKSTVCGLGRTTFWMMLVVLASAIVISVLVVVFTTGPSVDTTTAPTSSPSASPTPQPLQDILEPWIIRNDEDRALFDDPESPQSLALHWLSNDSFRHADQATDIEILERYVLAVLYFSTDGDNWIDSQDIGFLNGTHICDWNIYGSLGATCGGGLNVDSIRLHIVGLNGTIPWELSLLSDLSILEMSNNLLGGSIPTELCHLSRLELLRLWNNSLEGTIPTQIGQMTTLTELDFFSMSLTGTLPTELGDLYGLTFFSTGNNELNGTIPTELRNILYLEALLLGENSLTGTIPTELGELSFLTSLDLAENSFMGTLPTELGRLTELTYLSVNNNNLTGTVPTELGQASSLYFLYLQESFFTGTLPTEIGRLTNLYELNTTLNQLNGTVPLELGLLRNLLFLSLAGNSFTGTVPTPLGNLSGFRRLDLSENLFTGTLPTELGQLTELTELYVNKNNLNRTVPTELGKMSNLVRLYLQENEFTGTLPTELATMMSLEAFNVAKNDFTGTIPMDLSGLMNLTSFTFHDNDLTGSVNGIFCTGATQWDILQSDCLITDGQSEIECDCCNVCCNANGTDCQVVR